MTDPQRARPSGRSDLVDAASQRVWDDRAGTWDEVAATGAFVGFRDAVLAELPPSGDLVALDLGCGTGLLTLPIARRFARAIGLDSSTAMLARLAGHAAREGITTIDLVHADMRQLPLDTASVDLVVSCYAFHHLTDTGKAVCLAEVRRVLRPGGRLVVVDMMFGLGIGRRDRAIIATKVRLLLAKGPAGVMRLARNAGRIAIRRWEHPSPPEWWRAELPRHGFEQVRVHDLAFEAGLAVASRGDHP